MPQPTPSDLSINSTWLAKLALTLLLSSITLQANARSRELLHHRNQVEIDQPTEDDSAEPVANDSISSALNLMINGQVYHSSYRTSVPSMNQCRASACSPSATRNRQNLCHYWPSAQQTFEAAAQALGFPAPTLVCLMHSESSMQAGTHGGKGDAGLTQFIPDTARMYARQMSRSPAYQQAWARFKSAGGTNKSVSSFTAGNIRSSQISQFDVQIFATAMYFRNSVKGVEPVIARLLGRPPEPNREGLKKTMHFLLASYNAGPSKAERYLRAPGESGVKHLPAVTRRYIKNFDNCLARAATK